MKRLSWGLLALSFASLTHAAPAHSADPAAGKRLYDLNCAVCHAAPSAGFIVLSARSGPDQADIAQRGEVPQALVLHVVRNGIGLMPPFSRVSLTDSELNAISAYLGHHKQEVKR